MKFKSAFFLVPLIPALLSAQDLPYDSGSTGADGAFNPTLAAPFDHQTFHAAAFDAARGKVILNGGSYYHGFPTSTSVSGRNQTWIWDGTTQTWNPQTVSSKPFAQRDSAMAYYPPSQTIVHYGGRSAGGSLYNDHHEWNGTTWTFVNSSPPAGNVSLQSMTYDPTPGAEELIMFGGWNGVGALNTTWAWDGTNWTNKNPANKPSARYVHRTEWDPVREEIVLFGGWDGTQLLNDTWVWKAGNWTQKSPATSPPIRNAYAMGWDPASQRILIVGGQGPNNDTADYAYGDTWAWDGTDWTQLTTTKAIGNRAYSRLVLDTNNNELLLIGGNNFDFGALDDTWKWDATLNGGDGDWVQISGSRYMVDMAEKPDGIWNFTTVTIPAGITVDFVPNANNTPVTWLASGDVTLHGSVSVNGRPGWVRNNVHLHRALGGPGGFAGGLGGTRTEVFNNIAGTPGLGPSGGAPGITNSQAGGNGTHEGIYGNPYLIPLIGGSGGAGGAASGTLDGGNGGGGGGAILIASSRDITVNGSLTARGEYFGRNQQFNGTSGGIGSGGAIKLVSDRLNGSGTIDASSRGIVTGNRGGRVRLESYLTPFNISGTVTAGNRSNSAPVTGVTFGPPPTLAISNVDGVGVSQPTQGSFVNPDVVFSEAATVTITVTGTNIPDGTEITCKVIHSGGTIDLPTAGTVTMTSGTASFTTTIPAGLGTIQAFATYDVSP